jgi:hypothetical protein
MEKMKVSQKNRRYKEENVLILKMKKKFWIDSQMID